MRDRRPCRCEVAELGALARDVVDHQVEEHVVVRGEGADVRPGPEARVDLAIGQRREAAVARRRERRQDVHAAEEARQRAVQERPDGGQVAPQRVGVGQQLRPATHAVGPGRRSPSRRVEAGAQGVHQPTCALVGDATHLVVDVGEADPVGIVAEGQLASRTGVAEAARPQERRARRRGDGEARSPSGRPGRAHRTTAGRSSGRRGRRPRTPAS